MFPSPVKEDSSLDPATCRQRLHLILEHAQCKRIRFHDLRHTFCTAALENGMDVKTLSALLGHVASETTLNIYSHITDNMRTEAAARIDRGIGKAKPPVNDSTQDRGNNTTYAAKKADVSHFQPRKGKKRKPGTGCVTKINDHLWEGRYSPMWPDGKKHSRCNIYAKTQEECEALLPGLIAEMKAEIAAIKAGTNHAEIPDGIRKREKRLPPICVPTRRLQTRA